jgi:hypothetical protein
MGLGLRLPGHLGLQQEGPECWRGLHCGVAKLSQLRGPGSGARRALLKRRLRTAGRLSTRGIVVAKAGAESNSAGASPGGLFWKPFWSSGGGSGGGGGGGGGGGPGGEGCGGGGRGRGGDGSGAFESSGGGVDVDVFVEKRERREEEEEEPADGGEPANGGEPVRCPGFASLSSAAGDAWDGEAPLGDFLFGRKKRAEEAAAKVPFGKGMAGGIFRKFDTAAHSSRNGSHQERSGKNSLLGKLNVALCNVT